jgi:Tol biopolymer transport system component
VSGCADRVTHVVQTMEVSYKIVIASEKILTDGETYPAFTPDSQSIVFNSIGDGSLWRISTEGGEAVRLSEKKSNRVSISPDGTKLAYYGRQNGKRKLLVKSFPECEILNEFEVFINRASGPKIVWATDGKSLIYENIDLNYIGNLWRQSLGGEPEQSTNFTSEQIFDFGFSPDRSQLALVRGAWNYDAVLLKGFK